MNSVSAADASKASEVSEASDRGWYKWFVLFLLTLAYAVSMIDRQLPFILAESIKADLGLTDTQLGLLGGLLFAAFYSLCGIPLARLADLYPRKLILTGAIGFWCAMTALGGLAVNFIQLALTRVGVAVGEAGLSPSAHSLIADYFRLNRRATAIAIYSIGSPIGAMLGLMLGGWIAEVSSWRTALLVVGLPGILLALAILFFLREPTRGATDADKSDGPAPTLLGTFRLLWSRRSFRHMAVGVGLYAFGASSLVTFSPAFLMRSHGMSAGEVGSALGLVMGVSGVLGTLAGGVLGDILGKGDKRWYLWLPGVSLLIGAPCLAITWLAPSSLMSLIFMLPAYGLGILFIAPSFAMTQALVSPRARAMASAVLFACMFILGNSIGPTVVGAVSDWLTPRLGDDSLRWALTLTALTNVWGFFHYLRGGHFLRDDLARPTS